MKFQFRLAGLGVRYLKVTLNPASSVQITFNLHSNEKLCIGVPKKIPEFECERAGGLNEAGISSNAINLSVNTYFDFARIFQPRYNFHCSVRGGRCTKFHLTNLI